MENKEQFSFCIGIPWKEKEKDFNTNAICTYSKGNTVFYGDDKEAENIRKSLSKQYKLELKIYKLVEI